MQQRKRYRRKPGRPVAAVRLLLDTAGFDYAKWGSSQHCKAGDWIVDNDGDVYTVDADTFAATYRPTGLGSYVKTAPVWAEQAQVPGSVPTKEGRTHYEAGDYLVCNNEDGSDAYAVSKAKFEAMYELDQQSGEGGQA